ncbi:acetate uptake transporter [Streptomyces sp. KLOTTS4A1]|uniref:acetate uptake transporter n=1 Tax=Streptomyces sp. KLOTTS4A1 TaxID=3390996 RepID=UPI0039F6362F
MDNEVSAGSTTTTSTLGRLALGVTLLAFGLGHAEVIEGVTAADAMSVATYVGGIALFIAGLLAFRERDSFTGTAFASLGALWFTWGTADVAASANAAGLFLLLFALLALSLTLGAAGGGLLGQGMYGLTALSLLLLAIASFGGSEALAKVGGWAGVAAGAVAWYGATAALAKWPALSGRAAGRGVTAAG